MIEKLKSYVKKIRSKAQKPLLLPAIVLVIVLVGVLASNSHYAKKPDVSSKNKSSLEENNPDPPKIAATSTTPAYEVLAEFKKFNTDRISVYVIDNDTTKLQTLSESLVATYKKKFRGVFYIDFYSSRQIAKTYFDDINNKSIDPAEKRKLSKKYVGVVMSTNTTKPKFIALGSALKNIPNN